MDRRVRPGTRVVWLGALALAIAACSGDDAETPDAGSGTRDGSTVEAALIVGGGQDMFVTLADGDLVELVAGPQGGGRLGGLHIWMAARMFGIPRADMATLTFVVTTTTGVERASTVRDPQFAPLQADPEQELLQLIGVNPQVDDCCLIAGREVDLTATLRLADDTLFEDRRRVRVSTCPGPSEPGPNLCP